MLSSSHFISNHSNSFLISDSSHHDSSKADWANKMRLIFSPKDMLHPDGSLNHDYFKPKNNNVPVLKWTAKERKLLIKGIETYGIGKWLEIRDTLLPEWEMSEIRIKTSRLLGRQSLVEYSEIAWKGDEVMIKYEYARNKQIGIALNQWKGGVLVNDENKLVKHRLDTDPLDPSYQQYIQVWKSKQSQIESEIDEGKLQLIKQNLDESKICRASTISPSLVSITNDSILHRRVCVWFDDIQKYIIGLICGLAGGEEKYLIRWEVPVDSENSSSGNQEESVGIEGDKEQNHGPCIVEEGSTLEIEIPEARKTEFLTGSSNTDEYSCCFSKRRQNLEYSQEIEIHLPACDRTTDEGNVSRWCLETELLTNVAFPSSTLAQFPRSSVRHQVRSGMNAHFRAGQLEPSQLPQISPKSTFTTHSNRTTQTLPPNSLSSSSSSNSSKRYKRSISIHNSIDTPSSNNSIQNTKKRKRATVQEKSPSNRKIITSSKNINSNGVHHKITNTEGGNSIPEVSHLPPSSFSTSYDPSSMKAPDPKRSMKRLLRSEPESGLANSTDSSSVQPDFCLPPAPSSSPTSMLLSFTSSPQASMSSSSSSAAATTNTASHQQDFPTSYISTRGTKNKSNHKPNQQQEHAVSYFEDPAGFSPNQPISTRPKREAFSKACAIALQASEYKQYSSSSDVYHNYGDDDDDYDDDGGGGK